MVSLHWLKVASKCLSCPSLVGILEGAGAELVEKILSDMSDVKSSREELAYGYDVACGMRVRVGEKIVKGDCNSRHLYSLYRGSSDYKYVSQIHDQRPTIQYFAKAEQQRRTPR